MYFENQPDDHSVNDWTSIFQVTGDGDSPQNLGYGIPGLFAKKHPTNSDLVVLQFRNMLDDGSGKNHGFNLNVDKFTYMNVKISEFDELYSISIDNQVVSSRLNYFAQERESVEVQMAKPTKANLEPTSGKYRNFEFDLCPTRNGKS